CFFSFVWQRFFRLFYCFLVIVQLELRPTLFPYTTLFRSNEFPSLVPPNKLMLPVAISRLGLNSKLLILLLVIAPLSYKLSTIFRSEEHTSELQSRFDIVCRLLLEKKQKAIRYRTANHITT